MKIIKFVFIFVAFLLLNGCQDHLKDNGYYSEVATCEQQGLRPDTAQVDCTVTKWYDGKEKAVVFTWDDGCHGISEVRKMFDKHGLKTTFFVNTEVIDNWYLKIRLFYKGTINGVIKDALKNGHEVGAHTHDHLNLTKIPLEQVEEQLKLSSSVLYEKYGYYPTTMSHPESCYNEKIDSLMHIYFADSRYSTKNDGDTTIRYMQVRTSYATSYYKKNFDSFIQSTADLYVYGGHQLNGGYEPMGSMKLDSLLYYIEGKYSEICWITTFEDVVMYKILRDRVSIKNEKGKVVVDTSEIQEIMKRFSHPHVFLTFRFDNVNLDFASEGLVCYRYDGKDSYCTIDLRKTSEFKYSIIDMSFKVQEPIRNKYQ